MAPSRRMKALKTRSWFKPLRRGNKKSLDKDFPTKTGPSSPTKDQPQSWKVKGPASRQNGTQDRKEIPCKVVEAPVFIPYTRDSKLRKSLQALDDKLGKCLGSPSVRFVERCGGRTLTDLLGTSNPWAKM